MPCWMRSKRELIQLKTILRIFLSYTLFINTIIMTNSRHLLFSVYQMYMILLKTNYVTIRKQSNCTRIKFHVLGSNHERTQYILKSIVYFHRSHHHLYVTVIHTVVTSYMNNCSSMFYDTSDYDINSLQIVLLNQ